MKKQDLFANMFAGAIRWDVVEENTDALASVLLKKDDNDRKGDAEQ